MNDDDSASASRSSSSGLNYMDKTGSKSSLRSVNFEDLENSAADSADFNNSGYMSPNSSANLGSQTPRPTNPNRPQTGSKLGSSEKVVAGSTQGNQRPGLGRSLNGSVRSGSFRNDVSPNENSRKDLLQTMRSIRGIQPRIYVRKYSVGGMRYAAEKRQIAGMMVMFGLASVFQPLYSACALTGSNGSTQTVGIDFAILFGDFCIILLGIIAVGIGLAEFIAEFGSEKYTSALLLWSQTGLIWVISSMTAVGRQAASGVGIIPESYEPSEILNRFLGAMGILAIGAYGFAMIGSITFMGFSLYAFQVMKPQDRDRDYYVSRAAVYSGALFLAGLSQLLAGIFIIEVYGMTLESGPIQIGFLLVNIPVITALIGVLQAIAGLWGFMRSFGLFVKGRTDNRFQIAMMVLWVAQLILQCIVQSAYLPQDEGAGSASTVAGLSFALNIMPLYLDLKVRLTLKRLKPGYFGLVEDEEMPVEDDDEAKPSVRRKSTAKAKEKTPTQASLEAAESA